MPTKVHPQARTTQLAVMVTRRCDMRCGHCSVASNPQVRDPEDNNRLRRWVSDAIASGVRSIQFTGGEPMLRRELLLELFETCRQAGVNVGMTSNGTWATSNDQTSYWLRRLTTAGLNQLTISYDRYHAEFQGPEPVLRIAKACADQRFNMGISVTRSAEDEDLGALIAPFADLEGVHCRFYDVQWIGAARRFERLSLRGEVEGFCNAAATAALTDDGRVTACNGPSYFTAAESPLVVGDAKDQPLSSLLQRHANDSILSHIRTDGPSGLRKLVEATEVGKHFPFKEAYSGMCELCVHINEDAELVTELRHQLDQREAVRAHDFAKQQLIGGMRTSGQMHRWRVNGSAVGRLIIDRAIQGRWEQNAERILGRHDLDWQHFASYVSQCGLAPTLAEAVEDEEFRRWAPRFVVERIQEAAIRWAIHANIHKYLLERIGEVLEGMGVCGVLLKGAAWLATEDRYSFPVRASGDIDLYVEGDAAVQLHRQLAASGFARTTKHEWSAPHHLAMLTARGVGLEIHTSFTGPKWGYPQQEMLAVCEPVRSLPGPFDILSAEGRLLHAAVHCSQHQFSHGGKLAWELAVHHRQGIDWQQLKRWVDALRMPRAFWVPFEILSGDLRLDVPQTFFASAPRDQRQERLQFIARRRIWRIAEHSYDPNIVVRQVVNLMMEQSWLRQAHSLTGFAMGSLRPWRRSTRSRALNLKGESLLQQGRTAFLDWRRYRAAFQRERAVEKPPPLVTS